MNPDRIEKVLSSINFHIGVIAWLLFALLVIWVIAG